MATRRCSVPRRWSGCSRSTRRHALIALYLEDFGDGRALLEAAYAARAGGTPVVLLAAEPGAAVARAALSHTGALASGEAAIEAACAAAGIHRVRTPRELVDVADALLRCPSPRGRRIAVVADGGGQGALAAGLLERAGMPVGAMAPSTHAEIAALLPPAAAAGNPIDLAGGAERDVATFTRVCAALARSGEVDGILISGFLGGYGGYGAAIAAAELEVARALGALAHEHGIALAVHSMHPHSPAAGALRASGVPVYGEVERAVAALAGLTHDRPAGGIPALPPRRPAVAARDLSAGGGAPVPAHAAAAARDSSAGGVAPAHAAPAAAIGYAQARALLQAGGVPLVPAAIVPAEEVLAAARELGYPVALKALGELHKSDGGGVALALGDEPALSAALAAMTARLSPLAFSVERMAAGGIELIAGVRRDAHFGPLVLVGAGGIYAELLRRHRRRARAGRRGGSGAAAAVAEDRAAAARRPRPPAARPAGAAQAVAALSLLAAAHPELAELEANPLLVMRAGCVALDARVVP